VAGLSVEDSPATSTSSPACVVPPPAVGWTAGEPPWASDACPFDGYSICQVTTINGCHATLLAWSTLKTVFDN